MASTISGDTTKSDSIWDSLYGTVSDTLSRTASDTVSEVAGSAGSTVQNWLKGQVQAQLLDPLERDTYIPENAERQNIQQLSTTGQSPRTNIPETQQVLFDYKPTSSGNTAVFYIVGGVVVFLFAAMLFRR